MAEGVNQQADQAADQGAVDADKLQIAADGKLEFVAHLAAVPAFHFVGDKFGGGVAVAAHQAAGEQGEAHVEAAQLLRGGGVLLQQVGEQAVQPACSGGIGALGIGGEAGGEALPQLGDVLLQLGRVGQAAFGQGEFALPGF